MLVGQHLKTLEGNLERVQCMELVGAQVWSGSSFGMISVHNAKTGAFVLKIQAPGRGKDEDFVACLTLINGMVWCGSSDGIINVFDVKTGRVQQQLLGHSGSVNCIVASNYFVWSGSGDRTIRAWDPESGKQKKILTGHTNWVRCLTIYDGKIWSGSDDCSIRVWDESTGVVLQDLRGHSGGILCLVVVDNQIWSGSADKTIRTWDGPSCRPLRELRGHNGWITCMIYSSSHVWSGSSDKTIKLWNPKNGNLVKTIEGHSGWVWSLLAVGYQVWSGSGDKTIRTWLCGERAAPKHGEVNSPSKLIAPGNSSPSIRNIGTTPEVSPIKRRDLSSDSDKQWDLINQEIEEQNEQLSKKVKLQQLHIDSLKSELSQSQLEKSRNEESDDGEDLRQEVEKAKLRTELEEMKRALSKERNNAEAVKNFQNRFESEVRNAEKYMEEDLAKSLQNISEIEASLYKIDDIKLNFGEIENLKKIHEKKIQQISEEARKSFSRQVSDITSMSQGPDGVVRDLKLLKEKLNHERSLHKKKLQQETQTRIQLDIISRKLLDKLQDAFYSDRVPSERIAYLENSLKEERAKNSHLERELQSKDIEIQPGTEAFIFQEQLKLLQDSFQKEVTDATKRLELEVEQKNREHEENKIYMKQQKLQLEIAKRKEVESKLEKVLFEIDKDHKLETDRSELKKRVYNLEDKLSEDERTKEELKETINKLQKQLENSQLELHKKLKVEEETGSSKRKVQEISLAYTELRKRYIDSIKEWKSAIDTWRKSDVNKEELDSLVKYYATKQHQLMESTKSAEDFVNRIDMEVQGINDILELEKRKRIEAEEQTKNLLRRLDKINSGEDDISTVIEELFKSKKEAEDKIENLKKKLKSEIKTKTEYEETARKLQIRLEKIVRELEAEKKNTVITRKKLEDDLDTWKIEKEKELEEALDRLQEEDEARREVVEINLKLQQELSENRRALKLIQTEYKTKLDVEQEGKRTASEKLSRVQMELENMKQNHAQEEKERSESYRQREVEIKEWKKLLETELADAIKKATEEELRKNDLEEINRRLITELEGLKNDWQLEVDELRRKLDMEVKNRMALEATKRDLYEQVEDQKKLLRAESNNLSEQREMGRLLRLELEDVKRTNEKLAEAKKDIEGKSRKISELTEIARLQQQALSEEVIKNEKRHETLRMKLEMETKLKDDLIELKRRLEKEIEESEKGVEDEVMRRKIVEEENWKLHMEISEVKREIQDLQDYFNKKIEGEIAVRNLLQENNERLHGDLEMTRTNADIKTRKEAEYEDFSKKLLKELEEQQKSFLDQIETLSKEINVEKIRRIEAEESIENLQQEYKKLKDQLFEANARAQLEESKRQFERDLEAKKRTLEKQLESRKRSSTLGEDADISTLNASQDASLKLKSAKTPEEFEKFEDKPKIDSQQAENANTPNFSKYSLRNSFYTQRIENLRKELDTSMNLISDNRKSLSPGTKIRLEASPPQFSSRRGSILKTPLTSTKKNISIEQDLELSKKLEELRSKRSSAQT